MKLDFFNRILKILKFYEIPSIGSRVDPCRQTDKTKQTIKGVCGLLQGF